MSEKFTEQELLLIDRATGLAKLRPDLGELLMRQLDAALNPWGAPGEIPTERGPYWRALDDGRVLPCYLGAWGWISSQGAALGRRELKASRFRRRWTPAAPEGTP